jgi:hypothetical protein
LNDANKATKAFELSPLKHHDTIKLIRMFSCDSTTKKLGLDFHNGTRHISEAKFSGKLEKTTVSLNIHEHIMQMDCTTGTYSSWMNYTAIRSLWFWIIDMETLECRIVDCGCRSGVNEFSREGPMKRDRCHIGGVHGTRGEALYSVGAIYAQLNPDYRDKLVEYTQQYNRFLRTRRVCSPQPLASF